MAERIGGIVSRILQRAAQTHGTLLTIQQGWGKLVGRALAAHSRPVSLRRGRLTIHVDHPGDGYALSYLQGRLLTKLREAAGGKVEELVIRPGDATATGRKPGR